jgi:putative SOS response-associated peptidase YedK
MCGRARLSTDFSEIKIVFGLPPDRPVPNFAPTWNLAPTDPIPIVRRDRDDGLRRLDVVRWGLIPYWAKDIKIGYSTFNARCEDVDGKPAFREAFQRRRCLVPLDNFYEWQKLGPKEKQPYAVALKGGRLMAMAGLWETWRSPAGETVRSATIITCPSNELVAELHDRMPVILPPAAWPAWLGEEDEGRPETLKALLVPYRADDMEMWPVNRRVGNVRNNDPSLSEPIALA